MSRHVRILHAPEILTDSASRYKSTATTIAVAASLFGIPLLPLIYPFTRWYQKRFFDSLEVILTRRDLVVRLGVWNRQEKSIPLEKITDVALLEGPIMRSYGVKGLRVETAGQVSGAMGLVNLVGIDDPDGFRDRILEQRDRISDGDTETGPPSPGATRQWETGMVGEGSSGVGPGTPTPSGGGGFGAGPAPADPQVLSLLQEIRDHLARLQR